MKNYYLLLCMSLLLVTGNISSAQNLVTNPGFETFTTCPSALGQLTLCTGWLNPTAGSPDYFNSCNTGTTVSVPKNTYGNQAANGSSTGYAGFYVYNGSLSNNREYVQTALSSPLTAGQVYCVSFYVNLAGQSQYAVANIGAYFSATAVTSTTSTELAFTPQVTNPASNVIKDTTNFTLISGKYTAAGGEQYITIGNFNNDLNTPIVDIQGPQNYSYYYIEDVKVEALFTVTAGSSAGSNFVCPGDSVALACTTSTGTPSYVWSSGATTQATVVHPTTTTTYSVTVSDGKCDNMATVTVNVSTNVPSVSLSKDSLCMPGDQVTLTASGAGFSGFWWVDASAPTDTVGTGASVTLTPKKTTTYTVHCIDAFGCAKTASGSIIDARPVVNLASGADTVTIFIGDTTGVILDAGNPGMLYLWQTGAGQPTTQTIKVKSAGTYSVEVTDTVTGCKGTDAVVVIAITGVNELALNRALSIYPIPAKDELVVSITGNSNYAAALYSLTGQSIFSNTSFNKNTTINVSHLSSGLYFLCVTDLRTGVKVNRKVTISE